MPILQDFCQAFEQAIRQYETEWKGSISADRQNQIAGLRVYLGQCQNSDINALRLREEMIERVENLPFEFLEFLLGTRLNKALENVLKLSHFSKVQLIIAQCTEMQSTHQTQIREKDTQINTLAEQVTMLTNQVNELIAQLKQENTKDSVKKVNQLTQTLLSERENFAYVNSAYEKLLIAHQTLQDRYDALLEQSKKSSSEDQDKKLNHHELHLNFNTLNNVNG